MLLTADYSCNLNSQGADILLVPHIEVVPVRLTEEVLL